MEEGSPSEYDYLKEKSFRLTSFKPLDLYLLIMMNSFAVLRCDIWLLDFCHFTCEDGTRYSCSNSGNVTWHQPWKIGEDPFEVRISSKLYGHHNKLGVSWCQQLTPQHTPNFSTELEGVLQLYHHKCGLKSLSWNLCMTSRLPKMYSPLKAGSDWFEVGC